MSGKELRRTVTLSQQLSMEPESPDNPILTRHATGNWDGSTIRTASGRTLFDVIQQDDNWKPVKDRIRLHRVGSALSTASDDNEVQSSIIVDGGGSKMVSGGAPSFKRKPTLARTFSRSVSINPLLVGASGLPSPTGEIVITEITEVTDDDEVSDEPEPVRTEEEPTKVGISLMDLLEQTDNKWASREADDDGIETIKDQGEDEETETDEKMFHTCCICMVKHKGVAFVKCGHTFCRLCSRELWVSSENCPLCNGFVQEILDIF